MRDIKLEVLFPGRTERLTSSAESYLAYASAFANSSGGDLYFLPAEGEMLPEEASCIIREIEGKLLRVLSPAPPYTIAATIIGSRPCVRLNIRKANMKPVRIGDTAYLENEGQLRKAAVWEINALEKDEERQWTEKAAASPLSIEHAKLGINALLPEGSRNLRKSDLMRLGLLTATACPSNALLLCSDETPEHASVKVSLSHASKTFHGPVFTLVDAPLNFLARMANRPVPSFAREVLVNALIHRDYSIERPVEITYSGRVLTIKSPGRIVEGAGSYPVGLSRTRNPSLLWLFMRLGLASGWGRGLERTLQEGSEFSPCFYETYDSFVFQATLPELAAKDDPLTRRELIILSYIKDHGYIKNSDGQALLGLSESSIVKLLALMVKKGLVRSQGERKARIYLLP